MENIILQSVQLDALLNQIRNIVKQEVMQASAKEPVRDIIGVTEAAKFLGLSKSTIYRLTSERGIPFMKKNNTVFFSRKELDAWVRSGKKISVENI